MKKLLILAVAISLVASIASATIIASDDFSYADGSLVGNSTWYNHSGVAGDLLVAGGEAIVAHGIPSEDATLPFVAPAGKLYFAIDFTVEDPGAAWGTGTDFEYFAHFKDDGFGFRGRFDIQAPTGAGDFTVGIGSTSSTADATWPSDFMYGTTYRAIVSYDQDANIAQLWIDASADTDLSIMGADEADPGTVITGFALRQSDSTVNETIRVDNLIVSDDCADVFSACGPVAIEGQSWGSLKSSFR